MSATKAGPIKWGATAETGLFITSYSFNLSCDEKTGRDADGDHAGGVWYGHKVEWTIAGAYSTSGSPSWTLGSVFAPANMPTITSLIPDYTSGGRNTIKSIQIAGGPETEETRDLGGVMYPFMASS